MNEICWRAWCPVESTAFRALSSWQGAQTWWSIARHALPITIAIDPFAAGDPHGDRNRGAETPPITYRHGDHHHEGRTPPTKSCPGPTSSQEGPLSRTWRRVTSALASQMSINSQRIGGHQWANAVGSSELWTDPQLLCRLCEDHYWGRWRPAPCNKAHPQRLIVWFKAVMESPMLSGEGTPARSEPKPPTHLRDKLSEDKNPPLRRCCAQKHKLILAENSFITV